MLSFHPIASIFPMMTGDEFDALVADIAENGQREPIYTHDNQIIDGRNRYNACLKLGLKPIIREWDGIGSLVSFVVSLNLHRRHLTSSQRAVIALDVLPMLEQEAKERQGERTDLTSVKDLTHDPQRASEQAATIFGTNRQYVSDAKRIAAEAPEVLDSVRSGDMTITEAKRKLREDKREDRRQANREKVAAIETPDRTIPTDARFATIVIDPPWDWGDEGDVNQLGRAKPDYATMSLPQLMDLPVPNLADDDCHLYLWITNRSLPKGFALIERWGFRYITAITWVKPHYGMGNYFRGQTEHILFAVKGSQPLKRRDAGTVLEAPRGPNGHSSKPPESYELIESCSPGPYLEMFSRCERTDWTTWGENA